MASIELPSKIPGILKSTSGPECLPRGQTLLGNSNLSSEVVVQGVAGSGPYAKTSIPDVILISTIENTVN